MASGRPVKAFWYDGGKRPPDGAVRGPQLDESGALLVGEKGKIYSPRRLLRHFQCIGNVPMPEVDFVRSPGHFAEWVRAIKGGQPAMSNFPDYAGPLTETILLGNLAVWVAASGKGEKVEWDPQEAEGQEHQRPGEDRSAGLPQGYSL